MRISCDFKQKFFGELTVDGKLLRLYDLMLEFTPEWAARNSQVYDELTKYLIVRGVNYNCLVNYMLRFSSFHFSSPGVDTVLTYLRLLDELVVEDLELDITDSYPNTFRQCAELVCKAKGFKLKVISEHYPKGKLDSLYNNPRIIRGGVVFWMFVRYVLGKLRLITGKHNRKPAKVMFLANLRFSSHDERDNLMFGNLIRELNSKHISNKVLRYEKLTQVSNLKRFVKRFMFEPEAYIGDYYTLNHFVKCARDYRHLCKCWHKIRGLDKLRNLFVFRGYNYFNLVEPRLELIFNALSYIAIDNHNITKAIVNAEDYKVLVLDHEENMYGKGFMLNTRLDSKKRTLALSHEIVYPGCAHTHMKNKQVLERGSELWRPVPNVKCVWGEYSVEVLTDTCNYPRSILKLTGNPKFDSIFNTKFNDAAIIKKYGLSKKRKILFGSPAIPWLYPIIKEIAENNPQFEFIFKPHPNENIGKLEKMFSTMPRNFKLVDKFAHIYELIHASDIMITRISTVGFEAMLMGKPVFILNLDKNYSDGLPYVQSGAALEVRSLEGFQYQLDNLDKLKPELFKRMARFVAEQHYKNDGQATRRVADQIELLLNA